MARIDIKVTMKNIYEYQAPAFGYGMETRYIYTMVDDEGKTYVWKTKTYICHRYEDEHGWEIDAKGRRWAYLHMDKGDIFRISATVEGEGWYKDQPQTILSRVTVKEVIFSNAQELQRRIDEQQASIQEGDIVRRMAYSAYKEHYSDCETIIDSYAVDEERKNGKLFAVPRIDVIIRAGRLKASGVRDEHFRGYELHWVQNGQEAYHTFRAVSEENAIKQCRKMFPEAQEITCWKIYK